MRSTSLLAVAMATVSASAIVIQAPKAWSAPMISSASWSRLAIQRQTGSFAIEFDMKANNGYMDGLTTLSKGAASSFSDAAVAVRFNVDGRIDARNGSTYSAATSIPYSAGQLFRVRLEVNVATKKYTIKVTPSGKSQVVLGTNYSFRTEQLKVDALDMINLIATSGTHTIDNIKVILPSTTSPAPNPTATPSPQAPAPTPAPAPADDGVVMKATFDNWSVGSTYTVDKADRDFLNVGSVANPSLGVIVNGANAFSGNALRTAYPAGKIGGGTSLQFEARLPKVYDELYYSFRIRFDPKFNFVKGGKLTGICGGACNTGGEIPTGYDGWSARLMWTKNFGLDRLMDQYVYHSGQPTKYGDDLYYRVDNQYQQFKAGQWYRLEWRVKMNTPGMNDGVIQGWVDGKLAVSKNITYRKNQSFAIDKFIFSTFFGGGDSSWAPPSTQYIYWDDITISTKPISH